MITNRSIVFWTLISIQILFGEFVLSLSGLYNDNGIDQTIRKKNIPRADIQRIRSHILEMVGLPKHVTERSYHKAYRNQSTTR